MKGRLGLILIVILSVTTLVSGVAADARLSIAAMNGDAAMLRSLLKQAVDVDGAQGDGTTALHWATFRDDLEMTRVLLVARATVHAKTRIGELTPLFMAAKNGNAPIIEALLNAGADARSASTTGSTALMLAAASGSPDAVRVLLQYGADPNARDANQGQTALMFAAALNRAEAVRILVARGAMVNALSAVPTPYRAGARPPGENNPPNPPNPVPPPAQAAPQAQQPLAAQARPPNAQAARRGGRGGGNLALGGMTSLQFAAREGHAETVRALIESGADVNIVTASDKMSTLTLAILNGQYDIAKYLLDNGADPRPASTDGVTALYAAIDSRWAIRSWYPAPSVDNQKVGYIELMKAILDKGADINARMGGRLWMRIRSSGPDVNGATTFWRAAMSNDLVAMKFLIERGAVPNIATAGGSTPVSVAAGMGHSHQAANFVPEARLATVRYLVEEFGADVNGRDSGGYTPLHGAALVGNRELILYLIAHGGDVKARASTVQARSEDDNDQAVGAERGDTVADMANGPREIALVWPEIVEMLEKLGSENSHNCRASTCIQKPRTEAVRPGGQQQ